eukprot:gnl/TRDRNA2_/TRDRNA2_176706_c2_seq16.p1 gnl/TRDRNA2_/TRDRNA2_176706_c2~~gnl/TRDRNA2_/TRDRNA2_176706_c2_seq16.p1  ORF type:complete len:1134 (+),score=129.58 gnl/TRDRNA2_/TRDRNA2_176706_c2_seq16:80-3481(+)
MLWYRCITLLSVGQAASDLSSTFIKSASTHHSEDCSSGTCSSDMASLLQRQGVQIGRSIGIANQLNSTGPGTQPTSTASTLRNSTRESGTEAVQIVDTSSTNASAPGTAPNTLSTPGSLTLTSESTRDACYVVLFGALCTLGLWWLRWFPEDVGDVGSDLVLRSKRSHHLDNTKVVALFIVILSHLLYYNINHQWGEQPSYDDWRTWLYGSEAFLESLLSGISVVMMPMFCFVSGIVSQGDVTQERVNRFIQNLVLPTLIWIFVAKPVVLNTLTQQGTLGDNLTNLLNFRSFHQEWYLQAMVLWRGSAFLIWSHLRPAFSLCIMFALSSYAGYVDFSSVWWLQLDPALGFLPYFAIGYVFPYASMLHASGRIKQLSTKLLALAFVLVWAFVLLPQGMGPLPDGHVNYKSSGIGLVATSWDFSLFWMRRLAKLVLDMVPTLVLMFVVVPHDQVFFSWIGPHTLFPYLLHEIANYWRNMLILQLPLPHITSGAGHAAVIMLHVPYIMGVIWLCASSQCRWAFAWCLKPTWLLWLYRPPPSLQRRPRGTTGSAVEHAPMRQKNLCPDMYVEDSIADPGSEQKEQAQSESDQEAQSGSDKSSPPSTCRTESTEPPLRSGCSQHSTSYSRRRPIPWQKDALPLYPYILPVWLLVLVSMVAVASFMQLRFVNMNVFTMPAFYVLAWVGFAYSIISIFVTYVFHFCRLKGTIEVPEACERKLLHAVIVVAYKEPLEVLTRTCDSIMAQEGLGQPLILLLAMESRDETSAATYEALTKRYEGRPDRILYTQHPITVGETKGKSSNENYAVREVYRKLVCDEGMDPFEVLVTIVDADSVLSMSYLAHTEASFFSQMDGRRLIYSGPLNCFRNFGDGGPLVQFYELQRCFHDTYWPSNKMCTYYPQSNYSLTLGLCGEIGFWTPDSIPEDIHTANKASLMRFSQQSTIPLESIICNDLVTDFGDRYTQAKRHCFGSVAEALWVVSLLRSKGLTWCAWYSILCSECSREGSLMDFTLAQLRRSQVAILLFLMWRQSPLPWQVQHMIAMFVFAQVLRYIMFWVGCLFYWQKIMKQFDIRRASVARWTFLVLFGPLLEIAGYFAFVTVPFIHSLAHASFVGDLVYVVAPKGDEQGDEVPSTDSSKK